MTARVTCTETELLAALADAARPKLSERPKGFYTISELHAQSGLHVTRLRDRMRLLSAQGKVEKATVYIERADGSVAPVIAYKLKAGA